MRKRSHFLLIQWFFCTDLVVLRALEAQSPPDLKKTLIERRANHVCIWSFWGLQKKKKYSRKRIKSRKEIGLGVMSSDGISQRINCYVRFVSFLLSLWKLFKSPSHILGSGWKTSNLPRLLHVCAREFVIKADSHLIFMFEILAILSLLKELFITIIKLRDFPELWLTTPQTSPENSVHSCGRNKIKRYNTWPSMMSPSSAVHADSISGKSGRRFVGSASAFERYGRYWFSASMQVKDTSVSKMNVQLRKCSLVAQMMRGWYLFEPCHFHENMPIISLRDNQLNLLNFSIDKIARWRRKLIRY